MIVNFLVSFLLCLSGFFIFVAALGLKRFPDLFCRMHALCIASTLAKFCSFGAALIYFWNIGGGISIKLILSVLFILLSAPVSAHLIARAGYKRGVKPSPQTWHDDYAKNF